MDKDGLLDSLALGERLGEALMDIDGLLDSDADGLLLSEALGE